MSTTCQSGAPVVLLVDEQPKLVQDATQLGLDVETPALSLARGADGQIPQLTAVNEALERRGRDDTRQCEAVAERIGCRGHVRRRLAEEPARRSIAGQSRDLPEEVELSTVVLNLPRPP
jgi:hypothetical protein